MPLKVTVDCHPLRGLVYIELGVHFLQRGSSNFHTVQGEYAPCVRFAKLAHALKLHQVAVRLTTATRTAGTSSGWIMVRLAQRAGRAKLSGHRGNGDAHRAQKRESHHQAELLYGQPLF